MALRIFIICFCIPLLGTSKNEFPILEITDAIYEDTTHAITTPNDLNQSMLVDEKIDRFRQVETAYWFHFTISEPNKKWVIEAYDFTTEEFSLFYKSNGSWKEQKLGSIQQYDTRSYDILNLAIDIPVTNLNQSDYFIRLYSERGPNFKVYLKEQTAFTNYAVNENTFLGFFYGVLLIIAIYNLVLFVYLKERNHLFLAFYIFSSMLYSFRSDGFGFKFLWPSAPSFNIWADYFWSPLLFISCYSLYAIDFLKISKQFPKLYKTLFISVVASVLLMIIEFFLPINIMFLSEVYLIPVIGFFAVAIFTYKQGNTYNRFFIIGNGIVLISLIISMLREHGIIDGNIVSVYSFDFAICTEIIILSLALADRISFLKKEKEDAKDRLIIQLENNQQLQTKVNRELEDKVQERTSQLQEKTIELVEKNEKLSELTAKLNEMNSKLDYDNWKLSKNVEEETLARLKGNDITLEEFKRVYPDDLACLRFLRDLKWRNEYSCIKCNHTNYKETDSHYTRKCSKCGHVHSVTSNTLLHRIRIAPLKAFYITYVVYYELKFTNEELAKLLEIPENTCWRFRKKLSDMDKSQIESWENFLLYTKEK